MLEALNGGPLPTAWSDTVGVLKATGRSALVDAERAELGEGWRPLLG